jgi:hypothetical protein
MARAFSEWTPVEIAVDGDHAKSACIEVPASLVGGAKLGPAVVVRHNDTGVSKLVGISAAPRSEGEDAVYVSAAILKALDPGGDPNEPTPAEIRRARWTDGLVLRKGLGAMVSREVLGATAVVLAAIAAFVVTKVPRGLAIALLVVGILAALWKAIHEIRKQLKFDCA